jgi:hypothetical protein
VSRSARLTSSNLSAGKRELFAKLLKQKGIDTSRVEAIRPGDRSGPLPLTANQLGLWFIDQLDPGQANYSIPGAVRLKGLLDAAALERSLGEIVRRHESLRTSFPADAAGVPRLAIAAPQPLPLPVTDVRGLPRDGREAEALRLATEEACRPFDLTQGPLFRAFLVRLAEDEHVLVLNVHHIVADGWSMGVFTRELAVLYGAFRAGGGSPLPELPIQVADVALWEREWMKGPEAAARLAYWKERLAPPVPVLKLATDRPRPPAQSMRGAHHPVAFSGTLSEELRALSRREGVTLYIALLAAFAVLLQQETGQKDLVVGTGIANRERRELEGLIGYFVTVLPLRLDLAGNPTFRELLGRARGVALGATTRPLPLPTLVREFAPERDASRNPLFQVELTLLTPDQNPAVYGYGLSQVRESLTLPGLTVETLDVEGGVARFDMSIFIWDMPDALAGAVEYCTDLFETATVARLVERFESLLRRVVAHPEVPLETLNEHLRGLGERRAADEATQLAEAAQRRLKTARRRPVAIDGAS